jgi:hypothetical protein
MGRWRRFNTNAERQKAYRDRIRVTKNSAKPVTIPQRLQGVWGEFIRDMAAGGCSVDFLRRRFATKCSVIRAVIAAAPPPPKPQVEGSVRTRSLVPHEIPGYRVRREPAGLRPVSGELWVERAGSRRRTRQKEETMSNEVVRAEQARWRKIAARFTPTSSPRRQQAQPFLALVQAPPDVVTAETARRGPPDTASRASGIQAPVSLVGKCYNRLVCPLW